MKNLLVGLVLLGLVACGGESELMIEDSVLDCELAGGEIVHLFVENLSTGEQYIKEECALPKQCKFAMCKPGAENCPIICDEG